jgi:hypothetical protein
MIYFCPCEGHQWEDPVTAVIRCDCGRILEPITAAEHAEAVAQHEAAESV